MRRWLGPPRTSKAHGTCDSLPLAPGAGLAPCWVLRRCTPPENIPWSTNPSSLLPTSFQRKAIGVVLHASERSLGLCPALPASLPVSCPSAQAAGAGLGPLGSSIPKLHVWPKPESRATLCKQDTSLQQGDSLPRTQNRWPAKIWTSAVRRVLKTPGTLLLMCPALSLSPRPSGRASAGPGPAGEAAVEMKSRSAALPPSPASSEPVSVPKTCPSCLRAWMGVRRAAGCGGWPWESWAGLLSRQLRRDTARRAAGQEQARRL